jgi:hypothetical protein
VRQAEGPVAVAVIIGVVILIAAATSRTPRGISITLGVQNVSTPGTKTLQSANFQQEAFTEYTADVLTSTAPSRSSAHSVSAQHLERPVGLHRLQARQQRDDSRRRRRDDDRFHALIAKAAITSQAGQL